MIPKKRKILSNFFLNKSKVEIKKNTFFCDVYIYNNNKNVDKFAVIVSKKISKKATERNYFKRIIFSVIEDIIKNKKKEKGKYFVIVLKKDLKSVDYNVIKKELKSIL